MDNIQNKLKELLTTPKIEIKHVEDNKETIQYKTIYKDLRIKNGDIINQNSKITISKDKFKNIKGVYADNYKDDTNIFIIGKRTFVDQEKKKVIEFLFDCKDKKSLKDEEILIILKDDSNDKQINKPIKMQVTIIEVSQYEDIIENNYKELQKKFELSKLKKEKVIEVIKFKGSECPNEIIYKALHINQNK